MRPDHDDLGPDTQGFGRVIDLLHTMTEVDGARDEVPGDLWERIAGQLSTPDHPTEHAPTTGVGGIRGLPEPNPSPDNLIDLDHRRRRRWTRIAAAAAAVVLAAGTYGVISGNSSEPTQELVASVDLEPLKDSGNGTAELIVVDGVERLRVTADGLSPAPSGHHYEMWLVDPAVTDPQSVGVLPSGRSEVVVDLPEGVDPHEFPIVDVNVQVDGQTQHSGVDTSVLRGTLA